MHNYQPYTLQPLAPTGVKKALIIGINYLHDSRLRLNGCINDALRMKQYLMEHGFMDTPTTMVVLTDDQQDPYKKPTRGNIINGTFFVS
jgi:hypothetical protein